MLPIGAALLITACGESPPGGPAPAATPAHNPIGPVEVIDCSFHPPAVRPPELILACADLGLRIEQIDWKSWTADRAEGDGIEHANTCNPNCAAGNFAIRPVRIVLSDPVEPGHVFTKATTIDAAGVTRTHPLAKR
ncbi:hypothetical protein NDR87_08730 [Nocardia sp. CDC159]|uniref:hypothetical protein n=1 Tax=Nocardia TaxID=1817 RepID=UPI002073DAD1|nr:MULTISPECIES: hypothetical protein [Nocardia]MCM6786439.1 hypothetical protein [Nocardia sp. CDC159]